MSGLNMVAIHYEGSFPGTITKTKGETQMDFLV
jgi:hypothetical protein